MKTIKEINKEIKRLQGKYTNGKNISKDREISFAIQKLEWVKEDSYEITTKRTELYYNYNKLTRQQKMAFNALRKFEYTVGYNVTLSMLQSDRFMQEPDLVGFGEHCLKEVLKHPELFLVEM